MRPHQTHIWRRSRAYSRKKQIIERRPDKKGEELFAERNAYDVQLSDPDGKYKSLIDKDNNESRRQSRRISHILGSIDEFVPHLLRVGQEQWRDHNNALLGLQDVIRLYGDEIPSGYIRMLSDFNVSYRTDELPNIKTRFINTRRLDYANIKKESRTHNPEVHAEMVGNPLRDLSRKISQRLGASLTKYATTSQQLDSSFAQSIINTSFATRDKNAIFENLRSLNKKAQSLYEAGILERQDTLEISADSIDDMVAPILEKYCSNNEEKLKIFEDIYMRIILLTEIINRRFKFKKIKIGKAGIAVIDLDKNQEIPLEALSSGEQHELYLFSDLIFSEDVPDLIFIDEPEISLHVEWQESFVNDLLRIDSLRQSQIFIATHSPSIIGVHWDKAFDLAAQHPLG